MQERVLIIRFGAIVRDLRLALRWTQRELAARAAMSQSMISAIECGRLGNLTLATAERLVVAMGSRLIVDATRPFLGDRAPRRDPVHARCVTYASRRLRAAGWLVAVEVAIGGDRSRGWIDVLAFHPTLRLVLVIEVKTELQDLGALERQVGWYEREAWSAARRLGWRPRAVVSAVLLLATETNDIRLREMRADIDRAFPGRSRDLGPLVGGKPSEVARRSIAMFDPSSRRAAWVRPLWIDGRRTPAPYPDYVGYLARASGRRGRATDRAH